MKLKVNRKTLIVTILLILFFPLPKALDYNGSVELRALTYKLTILNKLTYDEDGGVGFGYDRGVRLSIFGIELFSNVRFIPESEVIKEQEKYQQIPEGGLY